MPALVALIVAVAELGAGFGGAVATGSELSETTMTVELEVTVALRDGPVVAHLRTPGRAWVAHPLVDQRDGTWATALELRRADWLVVFEAVGTGALTEPVNLTELGLDPGLLVAAYSGGPSARTTPRSPGWGWLSLACAAAGSAILVGLFHSGRSVKPRHLRRSSPFRRFGRN
ncbi:hypothetical protein BH23ACT5_BH23ACT5_05370 [soil metagenome]